LAFCGPALAFTTALLPVLSMSDKFNVGLLTTLDFGGDTLTGCLEDSLGVGRDLPPPNRLNVGLEFALDTLRFFSLVFFGSFFLGWLADLSSAT